jgi:hypothetical protein
MKMPVEVLVAFIVALVAVIAVWAALHLKTSRPDGTPLAVHPYRRLMFHIMPTRTESLVYFDTYVAAERLEAYLERAHPKFGAHITHAVVAAAGVGLAATPRMNRFVAGRRLYQRDGRWITFSMKRAKLDRDAKLATVKLQMLDGETFPALCARIDGSINVERSGKRTAADREFDLFNLLPRPLLRGAAWLLATIDYFNLLPGAFIATDPLYTSVFVANLGSLGMGAAFHHLYEYGTCPLFVMVGRIEEQPGVVDGTVVPVRRLHLRFTYDERIDDGLNARFGIDAMQRVLEDPERWLGGLEEERALWPREDWG